MENVNSNEIDKVWGSANATVNLGNYENVKIEVGYSRSLREDEDAKTIRNEIMNDCVEEIIKKSRKLKRQIK
jgi:hypothetical protein